MGHGVWGDGSSHHLAGYACDAMISERSWRRAGRIVLLASAMSCGNETVAPLRPDDFVGHYELMQVDGHQPGWYHQLAGVDCSAAFTSGLLTIAPDRYFNLRLPYKFRCLGANPFDGEGTLGVAGDQIRATKDV